MPFYSHRRERSTDNAEHCLIEDFEKGSYRLISFVQRSTVNIFVMTQVLEYCEHHRGEPLPPIEAGSRNGIYKRRGEISEWDQKYIAVDPETLFEITIAANNLDIKPLRSVLAVGSLDISDFLDSDIGAETVCKMVKGKTLAEARDIFTL